MLLIDFPKRLPLNFKITSKIQIKTVFFIEETTQYEVELIINDLGNNKASDIRGRSKMTSRKFGHFLTPPCHTLSQPPSPCDVAH